MFRVVVLFILLIALDTNAFANSPSYVGDTTGGPNWTRPFANGTCCSGLGPVTYQTQTFHVSSADSCTIDSTQPGWDGYVFVYTDPFDPLNQTTNFIAGDDDGPGGIGTSQILSLSLLPNIDYILVTTGFENGDEGSFTNTISCPTATVTLGPIVKASIDSPIVNFTLAIILMLAGMVFFRQRNANI